MIEEQTHFVKSFLINDNIKLQEWKIEHDVILGKISERYQSQPVPRFWDYEKGETIIIDVFSDNDS